MDNLGFLWIVAREWGLSRYKTQKRAREWGLSRYKNRKTCVGVGTLAHISLVITQIPHGGTKSGAAMRETEHNNN